MEITRIAVIDPAARVLWHVQTAPGENSLGAILAGGWEYTDEQLPSLLADAALLGAPELPDAALLGAPELPDAAAFAERPVVTLDGIADAIEEELARLRGAVKEARAENPKLTAPRFPALERPQPEVIAESFTGSEPARRAWAYATAVADLVEQWWAIEAVRRSRKYLQERYGALPRPLSLGIR